MDKITFERLRTLATTNMAGQKVEVDQLDLCELVEELERVRIERDQWARIAGQVVTERAVESVLRARRREEHT